MDVRDGRDIINLLMDFEHHGLCAEDRVYLRERAAIEIHKLRMENERLKKSAPDLRITCLPNSDAAVSGAGTCGCDREKDHCTYPLNCATFRAEHQLANLRKLAEQAQQPAAQTKGS